MRLCWYLLGAMLALESESTKSYGSSSVNYPTEDLVDELNYICNGDFEDPPVPDGKEWHHFKNVDIPCWAGTKNQIELGEANFYVHEMTSQVLELTTDTATLNQGFQQMVNLEKGTYTLKFDYAARENMDPEVSMFILYWNGKELAKYRPPAYGVQTEELDV